MPQEIELIISPFRPAFLDFVSSIQGQAVICSPYIGSEPVKILIEACKAKNILNSLKLDILTDISAKNLIQNSTDITALRQIQDNIKNSRILFVPKIHAKVFIADYNAAIIGSANFTSGGSHLNLEYGVCIRNRNIINSIYTDIQRYKNLGSLINSEQLVDLEDKVNAVRSHVKDAIQLISNETKTLGTAIRQVHNAKSRKEQDVNRLSVDRQLEDQVLSLQIQGKSINSIFSEAILFLLATESLTTVEINVRIQELYPELCSDAEERVIDGKRFGKRWKHQVRGAQVTLKRNGVINNDRTTKRWQITR